MHDLKIGAAAGLPMSYQRAFEDAYFYIKWIVLQKWNSKPFISRDDQFFEPKYEKCMEFRDSVPLSQKWAPIWQFAPRSIILLPH